MSSTTPLLLRGLVDDAAVFPPAETPLPDAVHAHGVHRTSWYAGCIGPLLVPATSVADLLEVLDGHDRHHAHGAATAHAEANAGTAHPGSPLDVVLVARPGTDPALVTSALDALREETRVRVAGAELGWQEDWRDLGLDDLALALEAPRGEEHDLAVGDIGTAAREGRPVVAKFRTGPTPVWPWPDEAELADFLVTAATGGVPFKLTGGLHHAVRGTYEVAGVPEENHGVLNVLVATAAAAEGAGPDEVRGLLGVQDAVALAELVLAWPDDTAARVRSTFTAYGCCTVTDPVEELADLGLLHRP